MNIINRIFFLAAMAVMGITISTLMGCIGGESALSAEYGLSSELTFRDVDGKRENIARVDYDYNQHGWLLEIRELVFAGETSEEVIVAETHYDYTDEGLIQSVTFYDVYKGAAPVRSLYRYENGVLDEVATASLPKNSEPIVLEFRRYHYDETGRVTQTNQWIAQGNDVDLEKQDPDSFSSYSYDELNRVTQYSHHDQTGKAFFQEAYTYNSNGFPLEIASETRNSGAEWAPEKVISFDYEKDELIGMAYAYPVMGRDGKIGREISSACNIKKDESGRVVERSECGTNQNETVVYSYTKEGSSHTWELQWGSDPFQLEMFFHYSTTPNAYAR